MSIHLVISASLPIYLCEVEQSFLLQVPKNYPAQPHHISCQPFSFFDNERSLSTKEELMIVQVYPANFTEKGVWYQSFARTDKNEKCWLKFTTWTSKTDKVGTCWLIIVTTTRTYCQISVTGHPFALQQTFEIRLGQNIHCNRWKDKIWNQ